MPDAAWPRDCHPYWPGKASSVSSSVHCNGHARPARWPDLAPRVRVDRVIERARRFDGNVALVSHGHLLRVLAARWIDLSATGGQHFLLGTGTLCVLGYYRDEPAVKIWNGPIAT